MNNLKSYTIHFETLGCKLNQIESESLAKCFADCGFSICMEHETANEVKQTEPILCIINTCTVTAKAEQKARRLIRMLLSKFTKSLIIVTGCYAQVEPAQIEAIDKRVIVIPGELKEEMADFAPYFANNFLQIENKINESDFSSLLLEKIKSWHILQNFKNEQVSSIKFNKNNAHNIEQNKSGQHAKIEKTQNPQNILSLKSEFEKLPSSGTKFKLVTDTFYNHSRASIKIQDGCSRHCSFCRICIARNTPVSLNAGEVLSRVLQIEQSGQKEIVITGVNLSLYKSQNPFKMAQIEKVEKSKNGESGENAGKIENLAAPPATTSQNFNKIEQIFNSSLKEREYFDLADLLEYLLLNTKSVSFRISSLYPERVDDALCKIIQNERIRPHFHLSVQSGSDNILHAMKRPYFAKTVINAVKNIRKIKPSAFIACDIIAGFPGETEQDFELTKELCQKCNFTWIHAFPFSPRPGTEAYKMKNQIPQRVANERVKWLCDEAKKNKKIYIENFIGKEVLAIVEKRRTNPVRAVSENFLHLELLGDQNKLVALQGKEVRVKIISSKTISLNDEIECTACLV